MMKVEMNMKDFKEMTEKVLPAICKKSCVSILETILLYTENGALNMVANDMEAELKAFKSATVLSDGSCCISYNDMKQIIKLKADNIVLENDTESKKVVICTGKKTVTVGSNYDTTEFPRFTYSTVQTAYTTRGSDLLETLDKLSYYSSKDDNNKMMSTYCFDFKKNRIVSLDGHRLGIRHIVGGVDPNNKAEEILLSRNIYPKLKKCLKTDDNVSINTCQSDTSCHFSVISGNDFILTTRIVDGKYFDVDKLIVSKHNVNMCKLHTKELEEVAKYNVNLLKADIKKPMLMYNNNGSMVSYAIGSMGESMDIMETKENYTKSGLMIGFNPTFLLELCKTVDTEVLEIGFTNPKAPMMVYGKEYDFLILPVNVKETEAEEFKSNINKLLEKVA